MPFIYQAGKILWNLLSFCAVYYYRKMSQMLILSGYFLLKYSTALNSAIWPSPTALAIW